MTVKRYEEESDPQDGPCSIWMEESVEGNYVTYSDYQKLVAECDDFKKSAEYSAATNKKIVATNARLSDENTGLRSDLEKLTAENVGLNIDRLAWAELYADTVGDHPLYERSRELPTPATDAAIAEIKSEEAQNMYESILDNPSVYDMESLVDSLESYAENKKAFAANLRAGRKG